MAEIRNYHLEMIQEINRINGRRPSLFLHACCGPCLTYPLTYLHKYFNVTVGYLNPNIYPESEWNKRLNTLKQFLGEFGKRNKCEIPLMVLSYDHQVFLDNVKGLELCQEGGERCLTCHRQRLELSYSMASTLKAEYFTTVMTVSSHKPSRIINEIGMEISKKYPRTKYLLSDFKKDDGQRKGVDIAKEYDLYRQNYCGCEFALR